MEPTADRAASVLANRLNLSLQAIADAVRIAANDGAPAAIEHLADYLNNCDAVEEGDAKHFERWKARAARERRAAADMRRLLVEVAGMLELAGGAAGTIPYECSGAGGAGGGVGSWNVAETIAAIRQLWRQAAPEPAPLPESHAAP